MIKIKVMKETVFKVGDKVFDVLNGWGVVTRIFDHGNYPIEVITTNESGEEETCSYTLCGKYFQESPQPTLSFTEYTLNGFSQEYPIELPELGEEIMVSDDGNVWEIGRFREYTPQHGYPVEVERDGAIIYYTLFKRLR